MSFDRKAYYERTKEKQLARVKAWRKANPERHSATSAKCRNNRRFKDPVGFLYQRTKDRAIEQGIVFSISKEDIQIPDVCPMLGIPLFFNESGSGEKNPNSPSIDRIDPSKGYEVGNILICSWRANQLKNDGTLEELEKIVAYLREHMAS